MRVNTKIMAVAVIIATAYHTSVSEQSEELARAAKCALADMRGEL